MKDLDPTTGELIERKKKKKNKTRSKSPLKSPPKERSSFEHGPRATKDISKLRHSRIHSNIENFAKVDEYDPDLDDSRDRPLKIGSDDSDVDSDVEEEYKPAKEDISTDSEDEFDIVTKAMKSSLSKRKYFCTR